MEIFTIKIVINSSLSNGEIEAEVEVKTSSASEAMLVAESYPFFKRFSSTF